jgi:hypothetical protein
MDLLSLTLGLLVGFGFGVLLALLASKVNPMVVTLNQPTTQDVHYHYYPKPTMEFLDEDDDGDIPYGEDGDDDDDGGGKGRGKFPNWRNNPDH